MCIRDRPLSDVVAIQDVGMNSSIVQQSIYGVGHRTFSTTAETSEPQDGSLVAIQLLALLVADTLIMPCDIGRFLVGHDFLIHSGELVVKTGQTI